MCVLRGCTFLSLWFILDRSSLCSNSWGTFPSGHGRGGSSCFVFGGRDRGVFGDSEGWWGRLFVLVVGVLMVDGAVLGVWRDGGEAFGALFLGEGT